MPLYLYRALNKEGRKVTGMLEADNADEARLALRTDFEEPLFPESISLAPEGRRDGSQRKKISNESKALLTRQISTLLQSGVTLHETLETLCKQSESKTEKALLMSLAASVREGRSFSEALNGWPKTFDTLYVAIVGAGEKAGKLGDVLERLADHLESSHRQATKARQAAAYPVILLVVCIAIIVAMMTYVIPGIVEQFDSVNSDLPPLTLGLIAISDFISGYWHTIALVASSFAFTLVFAYRRTSFKFLFDAALLKTPILGKISKSLNTSRYTRALSILNGSGVNLIESLRVAHRTLSNHSMSKASIDIEAWVTEGIALNKAVAKAGVFPPMAVYMIGSGEASGRLDDMLGRVANLQEEDFKQKVESAVSLFEPTMIIFMSGIVLLIVMAILLPIMDLNNMVNL